jgi:hypothetical protein
VTGLPMIRNKECTYDCTHAAGYLTTRACAPWCQPLTRAAHGGKVASGSAGWDLRGLLTRKTSSLERQPQLGVGTVLGTWSAALLQPSLPMAAQVARGSLVGGLIAECFCACKKVRIAPTMAKAGAHRCVSYTPYASHTPYATAVASHGRGRAPVDIRELGGRVGRR